MKNEGGAAEWELLTGQSYGRAVAGQAYTAEVLGRTGITHTPAELAERFGGLLLDTESFEERQVFAYECLAELFSSLHPLDSLEKAFVLQTVLPWLEQFLRSDRLPRAVLFFARQTLGSPLSEPRLSPLFLKTLFALPDLLAPLFSKIPRPPLFDPAVYFAFITNSLFQLFSREPSPMISSGPPESFQDIAHVLATILCRLSLVGHSDCLAHAFAMHMPSLPPHACHALFGEMLRLPAFLFRDLLAALLPLAPSSSLQPLLSQQCPQHLPLLFHVLSHHLVLVKPPSSPASRRALLPLLEGLGKLQDAADDWLRVWGDPSFVKGSSSDPRHRVLSHLLLRALRRCSRETLIDRFSSGILAGVQVHLSSSIPKTRVRAMRLAFALSRAIDPSKALSFDELDRDHCSDPEDDDSLPSFSLSSSVSSTSASSLPVEEITPSLMPLLKPAVSNPSNDDLLSNPEDLFEDPDAPFEYAFSQHPVSGRFDHDDEPPFKINAVQDDEFIPYDMPQEAEDDLLRKKHRIVFLRDLMAALRATDDADRYAIAVEAAQGIIEKRPDDLTDLAVDLASILLHLTNAHNSDAFEQQRMGALTALVVSSPLLSARYLVREFFRQNYSVKHRLDILETMVLGAGKLAAFQTAAPSVPLITELNPIVPVGRTIRRWSPPAAATPSSPAVHNKFSPVAGEFVFPLLASYDRFEGGFSLLGEDSTVLSRFFFALANFIEFAGVSCLEISRIVNSVVRFGLALRYHKDAFVRRSIMYTFFQSLLMMTSIPSAFDGDGSLQREDELELKAWMEVTRKDDPDPDTRIMATELFKFMDPSS
ncbi:MAG: TEL2 family protein, partial [archaeon]|nr:TEL2 family protein [archaeon]